MLTITLIDIHNDIIVIEAARKAGAFSVRRDPGLRLSCTSGPLIHQEAPLKARRAMPSDEEEIKLLWPWSAACSVLSLLEALMQAARGFLELGTAGLAEKSAEEALYLFTNLKDQESMAEAEDLLNQIGPSGVAVSGTYEVEAIGDVATPGAAAASGAVQQKGPDAAQVKEMIRREVEGILGSLRLRFNLSKECDG